MRFLLLVSVCCVFFPPSSLLNKKHSWTLSLSVFILFYVFGHKTKQSTLRLREDGTLAEQAAIYLGAGGTCPQTDGEADGSTNMTIGDVSGVFMVLGMFIGLSVISWCMRRSPPAKRAKARRVSARQREEVEVRNDNI